MSKQRWSICIEGIPYVLGNDLPSWHDGTLVTGLMRYPNLRQSIDCMGGVATFDSVDLEVIDPLSQWARMFRVRQPREYRVINPNPINYNTTSITFDAATGATNGDILYAEQDTWTVTDASADPVLVVTRQTYTCLEDGWACRYQAGVAREHVVTVSPDGPVSVMGRLVAIYVDDRLEYLGRIMDLKQQGRSWKIRIEDALKILTQSVRSPGLGVRLRYPWNWNAAAWQAGTFAQVVDAGTGDHGGDVENLAVEWSPGWNTIDPAPDDAWIFEPSTGMRWFGGATGADNPGEIRVDGTYQGTCDALGAEWSTKSLVGFCTRPSGCKPYGAIMTRTLTGNDYLEVSEIYNDGTAYQIGQYAGALVLIGRALCRVATADTVNGRLYFDAIFDRATGALYVATSAGLDSDTWVELPVAPVVQAATLQDAITSVLTGTGQLGLGLPASIVGDAPVMPAGVNSPVWWDWEKGGIDEDLRAQGLCLCLRDGLITLRPCLPPIEQAAIHAITQEQMTHDDDGVPEIARGHEAPLASITYKTATRAVTFAWSADTAITRSALRSLELITQVGAEITDETGWVRLQAMRLRWMYSGIPVMSFGLLTDIMDIGDIITVSSRYVAAGGNYKTQTLPALVIGRDPKTARYTVALNIGAADQGACWAFGMDISKAVGSIITPVYAADLAAFASIVPVGAAVQITEMDQSSVLWEGTIASYQANTVTLSNAPTIGSADVAILTCEDIPGSSYGALQDRQVFAADSSGFVDTTEPAKELT